MGVPAVFADALVTAGWGNSGEDRYHLTNGAGTGTGVCFDSFRLSVSSPQSDITQFSTSPNTAVLMIQGLYTVEAELSGYWPRATQKLGNSGSVTYGSGYTTNVTGWELTIEAETHEWIPMSGTAVVTPYFRPGRVSWSGRYTALVDKTTAISNVSAAGAIQADATFKLAEDGAADPSFTALSGDSAGILITGANIGVTKGSLTEVEYSFVGSGPLKVVAGSTLANVLPAGNISTPAWDNNSDGVPDGALVLQAASGRTYSFPAFWKSINIRCEPANPIAVSVTAQGAGALTIA